MKIEQFKIEFRDYPDYSAPYLMDIALLAEKVNEIIDWINNDARTTESGICEICKVKAVLLLDKCEEQVRQLKEQVRQLQER